MSQHLLAAYTVSLMAVMVGQFSNKRFKGGMAGVVRLAEASPLVAVRPLFAPTRVETQGLGWGFRGYPFEQVLYARFSITDLVGI